MERLVGKKFKHLQLPSGQDICQTRLYTLMDKIEKVVVDEDQIAPFMPAINEKLSWMDRDDLLKRFVTVEFDRFLEYYKNAKDLNISNERSEYKGNKGTAKGFTRFFINLGIKHRLRVPQLIGLINDETGTKDIEIGKIEILRNFSFFEVDQEFEELIINSFKESIYSGERVEVQVAKPEAGSRESRPRKSFRKTDGNRNRYGSNGGGSRRNEGGGSYNSNRRSEGGGYNSSRRSDSNRGDSNRRSEGRSGDGENRRSSDNNRRNSEGFRRRNND